MSKNRKAQGLIVGIIGSKDWNNKTLIGDLLINLKNKKISEIRTSGRKYGADPIVKKLALSMGFNYKEFNPSFEGVNLYSAMPESYYGRPYHYTQLLHRMDMLVRNVDRIVVLSPSVKKDGELTRAVQYANKLNKPVLIITK